MKGYNVGKVEYSDIGPVKLKVRNSLLKQRITSYPWYKDYFIACGYQEIKNISSGTNAKKLVFYFNKLRFE